ncbi:MAG: NADPH-dependent glutamate synthase [Candidatus Aureabacteria bacterium]|nr:NADPH-dependent glutamate synthase [Candidatus Auribacterota bacterium]
MVRRNRKVVVKDFKVAEKIPRQKMSEQKPHERIKNFLEVPFGYTEEQAVKEASRCIQCKNPLCVQGCPVRVQIPEFIKLVTERKFIEAARKIKETNSLPAVCGRVCPQEDQCEKVCILGKKGDPVAIGTLERFVADYEREHIEVQNVPEVKETGKSVAVVGSGPAGLTVAGDLAKIGYNVTIFEALHKPGGVLVYGIPEFRLPKDIVSSEIKYVESLGVKLATNAVIGKTDTIDDLLNGNFNAVFIGTGAGAPKFMNLPGENCVGIYSANEYLTRANLMKAYKFPEYGTPIARGGTVAVVGGGNVAMDSARTAVRLGADKVIILYRRSKEEMPARIEEIHHAEQEGIEFHFLVNPVRFICGDSGKVKEVECIKMKLGELDDSGRRRPMIIENSEFRVKIDTFIIAIGNDPNPLIQKTTPGLKVNKWGNIVTSSDTGKTSRERVFAGGDIVTGSATVIEAMGAGKIAAASIHEYLSNL